jgi:uncharacterized DUF497 family protein
VNPRRTVPCSEFKPLANDRSTGPVVAYAEPGPKKTFCEQVQSDTLLYIHVVFVWDEKKNRTNRRKHGVSFETAARIFEDPVVVSYPDRWVDEEERRHAIGSAGGIAILLIVHRSEEQNGEEEIRIISARKASPRERALYYSYQ